MRINPEAKGIITILLIVLVLGVLLAASSGKLEQWGLTWFSGAKATDKIVFASDRSGSRQIYIMGLDGSDQKQLTQGIKVLSAPAISKAGNKIVFIGMIGAASQVYSVGVNGGSPHALTTSENSKRQPDFSPDGKKLSYIEAGRVFVAELNGGNTDPVLPTESEMTQAMNDPSGGRGAIPAYSIYAWGPDSNSLGGVTSTGGAQMLVYLPSIGEEALRFGLGNPTAKVVGLSWAVDRPLLAASIQITPGQGLVVLLDPSQKQPQAVYSKPSLVGAPAVSPDGSAVFLPAMPTNIQVASPVLLKIDTQSGKTAVLCKGFFDHLVLSPKGDAILAAELNMKTRKRSVVTIDPQSGRVTTLASNGDCFDAVWSPQSK